MIESVTGAGERIDDKVVATPLFVHFAGPVPVRTVYRAPDRAIFQPRWRIASSGEIDQPARFLAG
jgi:hypothetical protein